MRKEAIAEAGIDDEGYVFIRPASGAFEHIYRASKEIYWDGSARRLSHPRKGDWSPAQWCRQIVAAVAEEYGVQLQLTDMTVWSNVPEDIRLEIARSAHASRTLGKLPEP